MINQFREEFRVSDRGLSHLLLFCCLSSIYLLYLIHRALPCPSIQERRILMKYNKNATFSKELSSIQKTLDSYQRLYNTTAINAVSKSLMQFQSTMSKQLNTQAATATLVMQQALSNQMSASIMQLSKMAESYNNLAKSIGSSLNQVAVRGCAAKAKALASCINLNPSQTLVSGVASGILSNKNIDDDIVIPNEIAISISDTLGISADELEPAIPYKDSKKISTEKLNLYLNILAAIITILMGFYTPISDYFSGKSTEKYQHQMLQEEHKQTELLEKIHIDLQKNNSSTSTTKEK